MKQVFALRRRGAQAEQSTEPKKSKQPKQKRQRRTFREHLVSMCFIAPSFLGVLLFFVLPFGVVIFYALVDNPVNREFVGFENFLNVLDNSAFLQAAQNTASFSLMAVPLAVILALLLAMLLESKIPGKSKFRTFVLSPMMVPVASVVLIWQVVFHYNGALNDWISAFGVEAIDWMKSDYSQFVVVLLFLWKNLGYNMILFMSALANIPKDQIEAASVDGASPLSRFWHIKLRYLSPTILFVGILSLINSFKVFREVYLLTGDYPYEELYFLQHFMNNMFRNLDYQKLSAAAIIMATVVIAIIGILFVAENRFGKDVEQ